MPSGWGQEESCFSCPLVEFYCLCPKGDTQFPERKLLQDEKGIIYTRVLAFFPRPKLSGGGEWIEV